MHERSAAMNNSDNSAHFFQIGSEKVLEPIEAIEHQFGFEKKEHNNNMNSPFYSTSSPTVAVDSNDIEQDQADYYQPTPTPQCTPPPAATSTSTSTTPLHQHKGTKSASRLEDADRQTVAYPPYVTVLPISYPQYGQQSESNQPPDRSDQPASRLHISGLERKGPIRDVLRNVLAVYGPISDLFVGHKPFAIVTFARGWDAQKCMQELHHRAHPLLTHRGRLIVQPAFSQPTTPSSAASFALSSANSYGQLHHQHMTHTLSQSYAHANVHVLSLPRQPQKQQQQPTHVSQSQTQQGTISVTSKIGHPFALNKHTGSVGRNDRLKRARSPDRADYPTSRRDLVCHQKNQEARVKRARCVSPPRPLTASEDISQSHHGGGSITTVVLKHLAPDVTIVELMKDMHQYGDLAFNPVLEPEGGIARVYFKTTRGAKRAIEDLDGRVGQLSTRKQRLTAFIASPAHNS